MRITAKEMIWSAILLASFAATATAYEEFAGPQRRLGWSDHSAADDRCPTDGAYPTSCLQNVMPPYPICTYNTAAKWVQKATAGHAHCCGQDLSTCSCPQKNSDKFQSKIDSWCAAVETCWVEEVVASSSELKDFATKERLEVQP